MVTMANIDVVTDYLQQEEFLMEDREVRPVTISELGYTSSDGEDVQGRRPSCTLIRRQKPIRI